MSSCSKVHPQTPSGYYPIYCRLPHDLRALVDRHLAFLDDFVSLMDVDHAHRKAVILTAFCPDQHIWKVFIEEEYTYFGFQLEIFFKDHLMKCRSEEAAKQANLPLLHKSLIVLFDSCVTHPPDVPKFFDKISKKKDRLLIPFKENKYVNPSHILKAVNAVWKTLKMHVISFRILSLKEFWLELSNPEENKTLSSELEYLTQGSPSISIFDHLNTHFFQWLRVRISPDIPAKKQLVPEYFLSATQFSREAFDLLHDLNALCFHETRISALPASISRLSSLTTLELNDTLITDLPESIGRLSSLTEINLFYCQYLSSLPKSIGCLYQLQSLAISYCSLTSLPFSFNGLTSLQRLDVSNCQLESLPETIGDAVSLTCLNLHGNRLASLPTTFTKLTHLQILHLKSNPLAPLPNNFFSRFIYLQEPVLNTS